MNGSKKTLLALLGWVVALLGIVMIPYPGPGWLVFLLGLSILARQFAWAKKVHDFFLRFYHQWQKWMRQQPLVIKSLFWVLTIATVVVTLWVINGYSLLASLLGPDFEWLQSPFVQ